MALDIERVMRNIGPDGYEKFQKLKEEAIHLFTTNNEIDEHNINCLYNIQSPTNPVAFIKSKRTGKIGGRLPVKSHFDNNIIASNFICRGTKVAIQGRNFCPAIGLHNGAVGTVEEIIYAPGTSPNNGDLPRYVVVNLPSYIGPAWDAKNPKVNTYTRPTPANT
jgi:hypothetical protein